eukprot:3178188-Amphidinium_carterae.1
MSREERLSREQRLHRSRDSGVPGSREERVQLRDLEFLVMKRAGEDGSESQAGVTEPLRTTLDSCNNTCRLRGPAGAGVRLARRAGVEPAAGTDCEDSR